MYNKENRKVCLEISKSMRENPNTDIHMEIPIGCWSVDVHIYGNHHIIPIYADDFMLAQAFIPIAELLTDRERSVFIAWESPGSHKAKIATNTEVIGNLELKPPERKPIQWKRNSIAYA